MKRRIKTIIALALVGCMTIGSSIMALAYDSASATIDSSDTTVIAEDGETVNVTNDVEVSGEFGVQAQDGGTVNVGGDVTNSGMEYVDFDGGTKVGGEGVQTIGAGTVTVAGDVSAPTYGALADISPDGKGGGSITIQGNVNGSIGAYDGDVVVGGNVVGTSSNESFDNAAVQVNGNSTVHVGKNVTSSGTGVSSSSGSPVVVIEGTLNVGNSSPAITLDHSEYGENGAFEANGDTGVVTLVVYEIKGGTDEFVKAGNKTGGNWVDNGGEYPEQVPVGFNENESLKNEQIKNIFYIIKTSEGSEKGIDSFAGTTEFKNGNNETINAAPENTKITVTVKEGYGVKAGTIEVTKNADGSYSLIVPRGGGVTLTAEALQKAVDEIEKEEAKEEGKKDKKDDKDDDKKDESKTIATIASNNVSPFVAYAPVLTIGGGQAVLSGGTFGADTGIKMEEPGPLAEAAFAQAMPEGFTKGFSFSVTNGGQTTYSIKNGKISFKIPAQYLLAGRQFKLIGVDKDGNTKVFDNVATEDGSFEADVDIEGYQFELVYKD